MASIDRDSILQLQQHLTQLSKILDSNGGDQAGSGHYLTQEQTLLLRRLIKFRDARMKTFPDLNFSNPSWEAMIELYWASHLGLKTSVSALCAAINAPPTTALRHITTLEEKGIIVRGADPYDGRRKYLQLAPDVINKMAGLMESLRTGLQAADNDKAVIRLSDFG